MLLICEKAQLQSDLHTVQQLNPIRDRIAVQFIDAGGKLPELRGVFAKSDIPKGCLVLIPYTTSISAAITVPPSALYLGRKVKDSRGQWLDMYSSPKVDHLNPHPFWCVRSAPDSTWVNMIPSEIKFKMDLSLAPGDGDKSIQKKMLEECTGEHSRKIPVLVNSIAIKSGTELLKAAPVSSQKRSLGDTVEQAMKARKGK